MRKFQWFAKRYVSLTNMGSVLKGSACLIKVWPITGTNLQYKEKCPNLHSGQLLMSFPDVR